MQNWLKWGLILAAISIVINLLNVYFLKLGSLETMLISLIVTVSLGLYAVFQERTDQGGYMSYGEAFKFLFLLMIVSSVVGIVFNMVHMAISPSYTELMKEMALEQSRAMMENFNMPEEQLEEIMEQSEDQIDNIGSLSTSLTGLVGGMIISAIISAILAIFVKKENPMGQFS